MSRRNVERTVESIPRRSATLARLVRDGQIAIVGGLYDVRTGAVELFTDRPPRPIEAQAVSAV